MSSSTQSNNENLTRESIAAHESRKAVIPGGVNSNVRLRGFPTPLTFSRALGSRIWDVDGNEYVDYAMGMGPLGKRFRGECAVRNNGVAVEVGVEVVWHACILGAVPCVSRRS